MKNLLIFIFLLLPKFVFSQIDSISLGLSRPILQLSTQNWTTENHLPANSLLSVMQSKNGYIWLGSFTGLIRFDGVKFTQFNKRNTPQITDDSFYKILESADSTLWFVNRSKGILSYKNGLFKSYDNPKQTQSLPIRYIFFLDSTHIWASTNAGDNFIFNIKTHSFEPVPIPSLQKIRVTSIIKDSENFYWICSNKHTLARYKNNKIYEFNTKNSPPEASIEIVYKDQQQKIWVGTNKGLYYFDKEKDGFFPIESLQGEAVQAIFDDKKNIWIGTLNHTYRLIKQSQKIEKIINSELFGITAFELDTENNLWASSFQNGLWQIKSGQFGNLSQLNGLSSKVVNSVLEDGENCFIGGANGKINILKKGIVQELDLKNMPQSGAFSMIKDRKQNLWIATYLGVFKISPTGKKTLYDSKNKILANNTRHLCEDQAGNIWIATQTHGAICLNPQTEEVIFYDKKKGLTSNYIMSVYEFENKIWLATNGGGLNVVDKNGNVKIYDQKHGLADDFVFSMYFDKEKIVWIATRNGLHRLENEKITIYDYHSSKLPSESLFDIIEDDFGYLWFPSNFMVLRAKKSELDEFANNPNQKIHWKIYDKQDGMIAEPTGAVHSMKTRDGKIWIPSFKGVIIIDPKHIKENHIVPPVEVNELIINEQTIDISKEIILPAADYRMEFGFSAMSYISTQKMQFKYRILEYDNDWIVATGEREAVYTNLPAGNYTFQIIASNNDGVWNEKGASLHFTILPYFYQTWWFYLTMITVLLSAIFGFVKFNTRKIKKRNEILEQKVTERTEKLNETISLVKKQKEKIEKQKEDLMASIFYAKRIQQVILPTKEEISKYLQDYFVLFMPKDTVSGDFYFFAEKNEKLVFVAVDCTGHGVPGAFMTMIANGLLNSIIVDKDTTQADQILNKLHKGVRKVLRQDVTKSRDGMDLSLVVIDQKNKKVEFAGAKNPLIYIQNRELKQIKGNKMPIGGEQQEEERIFNSHSIDLNVVTYFYLFSDGYQDQFGGEKNKKFMVSNLRNLLFEVHEQNFSEQQRILESTIKKWRAKANEKQIDDILVVGMKVG